MKMGKARILSVSRPKHTRRLWWRSTRMVRPTMARISCASLSTECVDGMSTTWSLSWRSVGLSVEASTALDLRDAILELEAALLEGVVELRDEEEKSGKREDEGPEKLEARAEWWWWERA